MTPHETGRAPRCADEQSVWFFPPPHAEPREERLAREAVARALCATCPDQLPCLERTLELEEPHGIWGGHTPGERIRMRRRRAFRVAG